MTKETRNTGTKSANKSTDLKQFNKTMQQIVKTSKPKNLHTEAKASLQTNLNRRRKRVHSWQSVWSKTRDEHQRRDTTVSPDRQHLGAFASRAAPPTRPRPEIRFFLTFGLQKETSYQPPVIQEDPRNLPPSGATLPTAADPGGHGREETPAAEQLSSVTI